MMDLSEEGSEEVMTTDPEHMHRWVRLDPQENWDSPRDLKPLTPSALENVVNVSAGINIYTVNSNTTECISKVSNANVGRPSTSVLTGSISVRETLNEGSDFDSDFDDEFDVAPIESAALYADRKRDIPEDEDLEEPIRGAIIAVESAMDDAADGMIGVSNKFLWEKDFDKFRGNPESFLGDTPGPVKDFDTPYDSFIEIWDTDIIDKIAQETNRYAKQTIDKLIANNTLKPSSRLHQWTPCDANEIMVLFAVFMYMGINPRTYQNEYWLANDFLEMPKFKQIMSYSRYVLLRKFLHFVDNAEEIKIDNFMLNEKVISPKLVKLRSVLMHLNAKFSSIYKLDRDISIDESLTFFQGRLSWAQAIRKKVTRFGIKSYELCESRTGYLSRFQIYVGKNSTKFTVPPCIDLGDKSIMIVLKLLKGLEHLGHCVTMDNFYSCPALTRYLKISGFDCLGTLRRNRRHVPDDIANLSQNVPKGTMIARHCGDVSVVAWKDSKLVTIISTYHNDDILVGSRTCRTLVKPVSVRDYFKTMGGVDLKNQRLSMYLLERKKGMKWYIQIFMRLLNVSIHNAFVMYVSSMKRRDKPFMTYREFRYSLAKSLVVKYCSRLQEIKEPVGLLMRLRKDIVHVPKYECGRNNRKRCRVCYQQHIDKQVHSQCTTCNVFLCFESCWTKWHSLEDLKVAKPRGRKRHIEG